MNREIGSFSTLDYCQYLLSSQKNYTLTNPANHLQTFSYDVINSFLRDTEITPSVLWENVKGVLKTSENRSIICCARAQLYDDTVLDKNYSRRIELVRRQYSGNAKKVIRGIGLVTCVYFNPENEEYYIIDFRIFDKTGDNKSKYEHVKEMLGDVLDQRKLSFRTVLVDTWYATKDLMQYINECGKVFYCPIKKNRLLKLNDDTQYQRLSDLLWSDDEDYKVVYLKGVAPQKKVKQFSISVSTNRIDYIVTNDLRLVTQKEVKQEYSNRWKIELSYCELKQVTGIELCQCRKAQIQRNHIACALLVWTWLRQRAYSWGKTVYVLKQQIMAHWLTQDLKHPLFRLSLA